jgi:hypothetical protein
LSVFNGQGYLPQALDCILGQTLTDLEFLVIDDGSADASWDILSARAERDQRLALIKNEANIGLTRSLNLGLERAQGELIARQDVDDLSLPTRLEKQAAFMDAHPEVALLGTAALRIDGAGDPLPTIGRHPCGDQAIRLKMLMQNAFFHASAMVRRAVLVDHGLAYDPAMTYSQDYDLWSRVMQHGQAANLHEPLIKFRVHVGQLSTTAGAAQQDCGDRVALANFARAGLAGHFAVEEIRLLRRTGLPPEALPPSERLAQFRALRRLIATLDARLPGPDPEWKQVKREFLLQVRKFLLQAPPHPDTARVRRAMIAADPLGAAHDILTWLGRGVKNRSGMG